MKNSLAGPRFTRRALVAGALAAPFASPKAQSTPRLINLAQLDAAIKLDIRYATRNNFTGRQLYRTPRAFLQPVAAQALLRALARLKRQGFGLTIYDAYRPLSVTRLMWSVTPRSMRNYVANPKRGSRHNRGCAVDLTLHQLSNGMQAEMPSAYDEFSERAHQDYMAASPVAIANRARLRDAMQAEGFFAASNEWWHFDHKDWQAYPIMNIPHERL